ncbi:MAG: tRNA preQ1(34) S-adenosylmethionine ribosyltransferase-isomerase QueA [Candidatus Eisenbacteria bacterium]
MTLDQNHDGTKHTSQAGSPVGRGARVRRSAPAPGGKVPQADQLSDFDFDLPEEFVAQRPAEPRGASKLMVLDRGAASIEHSSFDCLPSYMDEGDCLVLNETRVMPCRLHAVKKRTGGKVELLFVRREADRRWEALVRPSRRVREGDSLIMTGDGVARVLTKVSGASYVLEVEEPFETYLEKWGTMPIPPYIGRESDVVDREDYQTVYARMNGSSAAPTAGLHFTKELLRRLEARGVRIAKVILHVGPGTFKPLAPGPLSAQKLDPEYYEIGPQACRIINSSRGRGGRVFAVGTTTARALETVAGEAREKVLSAPRSEAAKAVGPEAETRNATGAELALVPSRGWTDKFIYPSYRFRAVDALVTNFHLPRSSVLLLACAFAGRELILSAYEEAKRTQYRFYSYGDAMLVT